MCGLRGFISPINSHEDYHVNVNVISNGENDKKVHLKQIKDNKGVCGVCRKWYIRYPINCIYMFVIACGITWPCVYTIYTAIKHKEFEYMYSNIFTFLFPIQYFIGVIYHQGRHFVNKIKKYKKYYPYITLLFATGTVISIILSIVSILLIMFGIYYNIYSNMYNYNDTIGKVFVCIAIFISKFLCYNIFFANLITFSLIFGMHTNEIKNYTNTLEIYINNNVGATPVSITTEYAELKKDHSRSVDLLNNMFASIIAIGLIGSSFIIKYYDSKFVCPYHYVNIGIFLMTVIIYLFVMHMVKESVSQISLIIDSPKFIKKHLSRELLGDISFRNREVDEVSHESSITESYDRQLNMMDVKDVAIRNMIKISENAEGIDWMVLKNKLSSDWSKFTLFGWEIDDATLIQKCMAIIGGLIIMLNLHSSFGF